VVTADQLPHHTARFRDEVSSREVFDGNDF